MWGALVLQGNKATVQLYMCGAIRVALIYHIIESVDSISKDGPDIPIIRAIQTKKLKNLAQMKF